MLDHPIDYLRASEHAPQTEFERLTDYLELMALRMGLRLKQGSKSLQAI